VNGDLRSVYDLMRREEWHEALGLCGELLREGRDNAPVHHALALSLCAIGAFEDAVAPLARAVELDRGSMAWARDAGALYAKLERWVDAMAVLEPFVAELDSQGLALYLMAAIEAGKAGTAIETLKEDARRRVREDPDASCAYGRALLHSKQFVEAEAVLTACIDRFGEVSGARDALARVYEATERGDLALEQARAASNADPTDTRLLLRLAIAYGDRGLWEESRRSRRQAESVGLDHPEEHGSRLYMMLSDPAETAESLLAAAREAYTPDRHEKSRRRDKLRRHETKRIRVGYLTSGFLHTPSYFFSCPFLTNHDRSVVEVFLYNHRTPQDFSKASVSKASLGEHYSEVGHLCDRDLGAQLTSDRLDVLIHMPGHFSYNGLDLLCERVAPVQISYPHFPATTGCPGIDYVLTDRWTSPPGSDVEYSERLYRVPTGHIVWASPEHGPAVIPPPRSRRPFVTFGVFHRMAKFNAPFWDAVAEVLTHVPDSHLLVHNGDAELDRAESATVRTLRQRLSARGIDPERLELRGPLPYLDQLELTSHIDVALDSFPYNGQTTTCEALWMGVPVVTMRGGTHVSRVGGALLTRTGHPEWIAETKAQYVEIAASLASDVGGLVTLRSHLRDDFVHGGLTDGRTLARSLEHAYAEMLSRELLADAQHQ
jgi:protein O-GlcNAc transferase